MAAALSGMRLAVFGASGVTGGFAFDEAERRGLAPIAIGRDGANLRAFAERKGLDAARLRFADAGDLAGVKRALEGVTHLVSAVAPFAQNGFQIARAAAELGLGYTDSTGESGFMMRLIEALDPVALRTGATLCTGNGASAFLGDAAMRWIAPLDDPEARGTLLYDIRNYRPTYGTLQSYLTSIMPAGGPALRDGKVVRYPLAAFAGSACGIEGVHGIFPDAIVISRYWGAKRLDTLLKGGVGARPLIAALAALAIRPAMRDLIFKLPLRRWTAYQPQNDLKSTVTAHAEVVGADGVLITRSLTGKGIYPLTGQVMVATLQAMAAQSKAVPGVRAASEMFDSLADLLASVNVRLAA